MPWPLPASCPTLFVGRPCEAVAPRRGRGLLNVELPKLAPLPAGLVIAARVPDAVVVEVTR